MIQGCCAKCKFIFDLSFGIACPSCNGTQMMWARKVAGEPESDVLAPFPHVLDSQGTACRADCDACTWAKREKPAILELERMFALEDPRHG